MHDASVTVAAFVPYAVDSAPSQRFRIEQWAPYLEDSGIGTDLIPFADEELTRLLQRRGHVLRKTMLTLGAAVRRAVQLKRIPRGRVVFLHRAACLAGPPFLERWLRHRGHPIIYDFDDAIYILQASTENRALAWLKQPAKTATICRLSHHVVVGNSHLASWARRHNANVSVVPSSIDTDRYAPLPPRPQVSKIVVGWMGSSTSQAYLEAFVPMLRALVHARHVELRVVSNRKPTLPGIPSTWRQWSAATEVQEVAEFDIGIMPLLGDEWARGKCALKALQYMAMCVPTVASPVGANRDVIQDGVNGFLAATEHDWLERIGALVDSSELRARLGREGRRTVERRFSMRMSAAALATVIRAVAAPRGIVG